jgi:signal peptidase I
MAIALVIGAIGIGGAQATIEAFKIPSSSMYPTLFIGDHVYIDKLSIRWRPPERGEVIVFDQPCANRVYIKRVVAVAGDTVEVRCTTLYVNGTAVPATSITPNATYQDYDESRDEWTARRVSRFRQTIGAHTFDIFQQQAAEGADGFFGDFPQRDRPFAPSCRQGGNDFYPARAGETKQPEGTLVSTRDANAPASMCAPQLHFVVPTGGLFVMGDNRGNANDSRYWGVVPTGNVIGRLIGIYLSDGVEGSWGRVGAVD